MRLLLFDIDGTLVKVGNGVDEAVNKAISTVTGRTAVTDGVSFSGRTDPAIFEDILRATGVAAPESVLTDVLRAYIDAAEQTIRPSDVESLPGVPDLLSTLSDRNDVYMGLLTGNVEPIAYHKLRSADLDRYFAVGAFGSDDADRTNLPGLAVDRIASETGFDFSTEETIIIGDTEHDIRCAKSAGSRSVAVCTGRYGRSELFQHQPTHLFENFENHSAFIEEILEL